MIPRLSRAMDRLFEHLGQEAVYQANGDETPIRVIVKSPDQILDFRDAHIHTSTNMMEIRAVDIAKPEVGDSIILDGRVYRVQGEPTYDVHHLMWKLEVIIDDDNNGN